MSANHFTTCPLDCADACGAVVETDERGAFVRLRGNPEHSYSRGSLCGKTQLYGELVASRDRLLEPLVREGSKKSSRLVPATWDQAIARIVERVKPLRGEDILALWYGGSMGLVQRKFPLRMMHALGAVLHDSGICDSVSTAGYECVLGRVLGADIETIDDSDLVILWGSDVARTVQHAQPALQRAAKRGVPIVAIDVYRTDTMAAIERWSARSSAASVEERASTRGYVIRPGTDAALALVLARIAFELGFADRDFLDSQCIGAAAFETHVRSHIDLVEASEITGLPVRDIAELASLLQRSRRPFFKLGVGWTRRRNGAMSMRAVCSLAAVLGRADRVHYESFAHFNLAEDAMIRPDLRPPGAPNRPVKQVEIGPLLARGAFKATFVWCHNPAVTLPDTRAVRAGLSRDDLFVVVHEHFLTETAELADVVLPATMFVEHADVYRSYGHRVMQRAREAARPPHGPKSNVETFASIARALGLRRETWEADADALCDELIEASRARLTDAEIERLRAGHPVKLHAIDHSDWGTPSGKIELVSDAARAKGQPAIATYVPDDAAGDRGAFWLIGAPSVHTHNSTFAHSERHVRKEGPPRCHVHPGDARDLGLADGAMACLSNARGKITLPVVTTCDVPRGSIRVDGLPRARDVRERIGLNALTSSAISDLGDGNVMFSAKVDVSAAS
jgi:anaerobic selenocysteine-containing dehydrogenase